MITVIVENMHRLSVVMVLLSLLTGCSVLEQREECPCVVKISMARVIDGGVGENMLSGTVALYMNDDSGKRCVSDNILLEGCDTVREEVVKRGRYLLGAILSGDYGRYVDYMEGVYQIPYGSDSDSIYGFSTFVTASLDTAMVMLDMKKQFSTITFTSSDLSLFDEYRLVATGSASGLSALYLTPIEGNFCCDVKMNSEGRHSFRMPRQDKPDLEMEIYGKGDASPAFVLPLGDMIMATGYDYRAADLRDVEINLDFVGNRAVLKVEGWEDEWIYSIF